MIHRTLNLLKILDKKSSTFLFGARGTGKSSIALAFLDHQITQGMIPFQINLLESETYEKYLKQPELFRKELIQLAKHGQPICVFVDEIQRTPQLLNEVHTLLETYPRQIQFLLTGSSARKLKQTSANMLAGRAFSLRLYPFTQEEWSQNLDDHLLFGSLPSIAYKHREDINALKFALRSYVSTYLKEEIQQEALVRRLDAFARFLEVAGQFHTKQVNASQVAKAAGVSGHTIAEYTQILEDTLIAVKVPGWNASTKKQLRTTPKIYFFDNGVVNTLRGELNSPVRESSSRYGELFEGTIVQELYRINDYFQLDLKFSYWRTNNDTEVDIVVSKGAGQPIAAIEIKSAKNPIQKDLRGLIAFKSEYPKVPQYCICRADRGYQTDEGVDILPYQEIQTLLRQSLL
jgi:predicted AAA+ superfamily ATPase